MATRYVQLDLICGSASHTVCVRLVGELVSQFTGDGTDFAGARFEASRIEWETEKGVFTPVPRGLLTDALIDEMCSWGENSVDILAIAKAAMEGSNAA